jgi:inositol transport system ATP-binding protein
LCDYAIEMKNITKRFPGVIALNNMHIKIKQGSIHAIVGENGAGKSTLMHILSGAYEPDTGEIILFNEQVKIKNQKQAIELGISMIYQELNMVYDMNIAENIFLGREPKKRVTGFVDYKKMHVAAKEILSELGLDYKTNEKLRNLTVADMQMVEIAKSVSRNCKVLVMDEPTSAISELEIQTLFKFLNKLKEKNVTIIYISHKLNELFQIADAVTIIRDGCYVDTRKISELNRNEIVKKMVGREVSNLFPKQKVPVLSAEPLFEVRGLTRSGVFKDINFSVRAGEILGISGLMGSGRTEVARAIFGLDKLDSGEIFVDGQKIVINNSRDAIKVGIAMVPEDRKRYGLILCQSIVENITLVHLKKFVKRFFLNRNAEKIETIKKIELLGIKVSDIRQSVNLLSGGNQQKVVLAKWLVKVPKVFIMDEPTRGIDVGSKYEIYKLMGKFAAQGMALIMISSELPEILGISDRVLIMSEGASKGIFETGEVDANKIMSISTGGKSNE